MSLHDYEQSCELDRQDAPFNALIMCAMRRAGAAQLLALQAAFPAIWDELVARSWQPYGCLTGDELCDVYLRKMEAEPGGDLL